MSSSDNRLDGSDVDEFDDFATEAVSTALHKRREEYTNFLNLSVFVGSFNVNGQYPTQDLSPWLCPKIGGNIIDPPDIYAIGFQELDLSQQAYLYDFIITNETSNDRQDKWLAAVTKALHPGVRYIKLRAIRLVGILIVVFAKASLEKAVSQVEYSVVPTGIMNRMGNKGGCAISAKIRDSRICFVTSHLAAHFTEYTKRNLDFHAIRNGMHFGRESELGLLDHDIIFWFGDLNYRLQVGPTSRPSQPDIHVVKKMILSGELAELRLFDQLHFAQKDGSAFDEFVEGGPGHPVFKPTYKYDVSSDNFDSSEKNRVPAWTDRILFGGKDKNLCRLAVYDSAPEIKLSDHKPVYAIYKVKVRVEDPEKRLKILNEEFKNIDKKRNDYQPRVSLSMMEIDFGKVGYGDSVCKHIKIENVGKVRARLEFKSPETPMDGEPRRLPEWLRISPSSTRLDSGSSINVEFSCDMETCRAVYALNDPEKTSVNDRNLKLDCYVILVVVGGSHIFVSVKSMYVYSCFGRPLSDLPTVNELRMQRAAPEPQPLIDLGDSVGEDDTFPAFLSNVPGDIPIAIARLVHHVRTFGISQTKLMSNAPLASQYPQLREMLTLNKLPFREKLPFNIHTVALALPSFLSSLREPLVPYDLYETVANLALTQKTSLSIVVNERFPVQHLSILRYLVTYFKDLLRHEAQNGVSLELLSLTFGPALLRRNPVAKKTPPPRPPPPQSKKTRSTFFEEVRVSESDTRVRREQDEDSSYETKFVRFLILDWVSLPE